VAILFGLFLVLLAACSDTEDLRAQADALARSRGLHPEIVSTSRFKIMTYGRLAAPGEVTIVYLEGDGSAWRNRYQPSPDPTPHNPLALELALRDSAANLLYVARPCQFVSRERDPNCEVDYWTDRRFAPEIIQSINEVVDNWKRQAGGGPIRLVGYSGGGGIAILLAAERSDVVDIRTIAANLDIALFTQIHKVSAMKGSLNPAGVALRVARIPQLHLVGGEDDIVPASIADSFYEAAGRSPCIRVVVIPGFDHGGAWAEAWREWNGVPLPRC
jgi:pimeloyl-ACP methyl ester carboxylesterase